MHFKLAFIGFGTVGQGLTEILLEKKEMLEKKHNFREIGLKPVSFSDMKDSKLNSAMVGLWYHKGYEI